MVHSAREHTYDMRQLESYTFTDEHNRDQGINGKFFSFLYAFNKAILVDSGHESVILQVQWILSGMTDLIRKFVRIQDNSGLVYMVRLYTADVNGPICSNKSCVTVSVIYNGTSL